MSTTKLIGVVPLVAACVMTTAAPVAYAKETTSPTRITAGMSISVGASGEHCTLTTPLNSQYALTAGHCTDYIGQKVYTADRKTTIGRVDNFQLADDRAYIRLEPNTIAVVPPIANTIPPIGAPIHKIGRTTGTSYGTVLEVSGTVLLFGAFPHVVTVVRRTIGARLCGRPGDSGSPIFYNGAVIGLLNGVMPKGPSCNASKSWFSSFGLTPPLYVTN